MLPERILFGSSEWMMSVGHTLRANSEKSYHADLYREGAFLVRLSHAEPIANRIAAETALADSARRWISQYVTENHTGLTDFGELGEL